MARYWCERCGQESNTLSEPHLCADIRRRLERAERARDAVLHEVPRLTSEEAERIVRVLHRQGWGITD